MLSNRQSKILELIVENFIKYASPISSKAICEQLNCSSATIRNEMAALEDFGFLEKTHTSSGRIPSEQGYRYYVDYLMTNKPRSYDDLQRLQTIFTNNQIAIKDVIYESMDIISELTNLTAIVLGQNAKTNLLQHVKVIPLTASSAVALIVTDKGYVENKTIYFNKDVKLDEMEKTVDIINNMIVGTPITDVPYKLENDVRPIIRQVIEQHEIIYQAFFKAFENFNDYNDVHYSGKNNILYQPEFSDVEKIRGMLSTFDDRRKVNNLFDIDSKGINVRIGSEITQSELKDCTIITTTYRIGNDEGKIAVLGPKRMEYDRVVTLLEYLQENIEKNFGK